MALTKVSYSMINGASVNVRDFGAVGDGVADDRAAIQAAIDYVMAQGYGGEIWFPQGQYRVTNTLQMIGDYTAAKQPRGIRLVGAMGTQNGNPSTANPEDVTRNTYIFGDGIPTDKPVFYCWGGGNNTFEHLCIFGARATESATQAFACVWVDFNHTEYRFYDCKFGLSAIGIRVCSSYNHTTSAWTPGVSAYDGTTFLPSTLVGGFASDNHAYQNCAFGYHSIAGISIESAQALDMVSLKCSFTTSPNGFLISACQGISINDATFTGITNAGIYLTNYASTGNITVNNEHLEGGSSILFEVAAVNPSAGLGNGIVFNSCGGGDINVRGASGTITVNNSVLQTISMKSAGPSLIIQNTTFSNLDKTAALGNGVRLILDNCTISSVSSSWNAYTVLNINNCSIGSNTNLLNAQKISVPNYSSALVIGPTSSTSTVEFMEGVSFACVNDNGLFIGYGCYSNTTGTIIATNTSGGYATFNLNGMLLRKFTGATIGTTPTTSPGAIGSSRAGNIDGTSAINATTTATAAQVATGYITSTSAAPTTITLPTGTLLGAALGAVQGTVFDLYVDNTAGASTVTIAVATNGILSTAAADTPGSFGDLTIAAGAIGLARFTLMFSSATAYVFTRSA